MVKPPVKGVEPITSPKIKKIASEALRAPSTVTTKQTQELGASVMAHIEPRGAAKPAAPAPKATPKAAASAPKPAAKASPPPAPKPPAKKK